MTTVTLSVATVAYFKAAGVFRKRTVEASREAFDDAFADFLETDSAAAAIASIGSPSNGTDADIIFDALMAS